MAWPAVVRPVRRTKLRIVRRCAGRERIGSSGTVELMDIVYVAGAALATAGRAATCAYCPVAVTVQVTTKVRVAPLENEGTIKPPTVCRLDRPLDGHTAVPLGVQVGAAQLNPVTGRSFSTAPSAAADGLTLAKVSV